MRLALAVNGHLPPFVSIVGNGPDRPFAARTMLRRDLPKLPFMHRQHSKSREVRSGDKRGTSTAIGTLAVVDDDLAVGFLGDRIQTRYTRHLDEDRMTKKPEDLRSARWFAPDDLRSMGHRSRAMQMGWTSEDWEGRPVIAVINTWSDLSPCHHHLRDRAEHVKKGVLMAGGTPVEMPVHSFSEQFLKPTSMLY